MKKIIALILAVGLIVFICACAGQESVPSASETSASVSSSAFESEGLQSTEESKEVLLERKRAELNQFKNLIQTSGHNVYALQSNGSLLNTGNVADDGISASEKAELQAIDDIKSFSVHPLCGLRKNGSVFIAYNSMYSDASYYDDALNWENIEQIFAGSRIIVGLKNDGTVLAAGPYMYRRGFVQEGWHEYDLNDWDGIIQVAAYTSKAVYGLTETGTVVFKSNYDEDWNSEVEQWTDIVEVKTCSSFIVGLKSDGKVIIAGAPQFMETIDVSGLTDIATLSVSGNREIAGITLDGSVVYLGPEAIKAECEQWRDIVAIAAGPSYVIGLKSDGTVLAATGGQTFEKFDIAGWNLFN